MIVVVAVGFTIYQMFDEKHVVQQGDQAPNFVLENLQGEQVQLKDYRGQGVLLNFWATWCGPCEDEMPALESVYQKYKDQGFEILAVNIEESKYSVSTFIDRYNLSFPALLDKKGEVTEVYGVYNYPTTFLINKEGKVAKKIVGGPMSEAFIISQIKQILP
jgi:peroxiredoxin